MKGNTETLFFHTTSTKLIGMQKDATKTPFQNLYKGKMKKSSSSEEVKALFSAGPAATPRAQAASCPQGPVGMLGVALGGRKAGRGPEPGEEGQGNTRLGGSPMEEHALEIILSGSPSGEELYV